MTKFLEQLRADIRARWVRLVQAINGAAVAIAGGALVVSQSYPDTFKSALAALPPHFQLVGLFAFGAVVHFALSQAAKAPRP